MNRRWRVTQIAALLLLLGGASAVARTQVLFSDSGRYAFPVAGDTAEMGWTHYHWNGGNAVDILAAPNLTPSSPAFRAFDRSTIVAVTSGTVRRADNELGGTALLLFGSDGREYYYAHLSSTPIVGSREVSAGEPIGTIGRTGRWARYLEIHLHFAISSKWHKGFNWPNDVNAAEWFYKTFGLHWINETPISYGPDAPSGSPLARPFRITSSFAEMREKAPDEASIKLAPLQMGRSATVPVYSTLIGEVRVLRATILGLRVQITNLHTGQTVVYSGLSSTELQTGDVVNNGQIIGQTAGPIDYMWFDDGRLTNPATTLATASPPADASLLN